MTSAFICIFGPHYLFFVTDSLGIVTSKYRIELTIVPIEQTLRAALLALAGYFQEQSLSIH